MGAYLLLCAGVAGWVTANAAKTVKDWESRTPSAIVTIKDVAPPAPITATEKKPTPPAPAVAASTTTATAKSDDTPTAAPSTPAYVPDGRTYIAIIVSDMGLSGKITEQALNELPKEVSLAFSPYADNLKLWLQKAAVTNHETLVFMPMESAIYPQEDPGMKALSSRLSDKENEENLEWVLSRGKGTVGVINYMGSRFLTDKKKLGPVFETLQKNGSLFVEVPEAAKSEAPALAKKAGLAYMGVDLRVDSDVAETAIKAQLEKLEKIAHERGYAVGMAEPYPLTFSMLKTWSAKLNSKGIVLAPLATVWKNKPRNEEPVATPPQEQLQHP